MPPDVRLAQRNMFRKQSSTIRGETDNNDHDVWLKLLLNKVGFKNIYLPLVKNNIHDSLVKLMEQDIPTNYEEAMVDLSMRYDYES